MVKFALLIGVSEYEGDLNPLPAAVKDVDAMKEVLLNPQVGGFDEDNITVLKNPNRQEIEEEIEILFMGRQKDDLVMFFFSGHGIKDDTGRLFLATRKTRRSKRGDLVRSTAVSSQFVQESMERSRSKRQVVVLDSCFSGAFAEGLSAKDDGTVDIRSQLGGEGRAVLTSSTSTQYSFEHAGEDLSLYTRYLVEGMRTGEADQDEDEFISIDELHAYARQKVQEVQTGMKPEIYAIREGFKIRLAKVAPPEPTQRYRKEVARYVYRGEISLVGRRTLDILAKRLNISQQEARELEDQVLGERRQEFQEKLEQYEQVFMEVLAQNPDVPESDRTDLKNLQKMLGLRNEDTLPVEEKVRGQIKSHEQNLARYEQAFSDTVRAQYPLKESTRKYLTEMKQELGLSDVETEPIESQIMAEVEEYQQSLADYEQAYREATEQVYPLSDEVLETLKQRCQELGITEADVKPIEDRIKAEIDAYRRKLEQYQMAWNKATQLRYPPSEVHQQQLKQLRQKLVLKEEDAVEIETAFQSDIEQYQAGLVRFEQQIAEAIEQEYPLSETKKTELNQLQALLKLDVKDVAAIQKRLFSVFEERQTRLDQYAQAFKDSIQYEYPLSATTQSELKRLQKILELEGQEVQEIESLILENNNSAERQQIGITHNYTDEQQQNIKRPPKEVSGTKSDFNNSELVKLSHKKYMQEIKRYYASEISLNDEYVRTQLRKLQKQLSIPDFEAIQIEENLLASQFKTSISKTPLDIQIQNKKNDVKQESKILKTGKVKSIIQIERYNFLGFISLWIILGGLANGLSYSLTAGALEGFFYWLSPSFEVKNSLFDDGIRMISFGPSIGFFIGIFQYIIMKFLCPKKNMRPTVRLPMWPAMSTFGAGIGWTLVLCLSYLGFFNASQQSLFKEGSGTDVSSLVVMSTIFGVSVGFFQWIALKKTTRKSSLWIVGTALGEIAGWCLGIGFLGVITAYVPYDNVVSTEHSFSTWFFIGSIAGITSSLITGSLLFYLTRQNSNSESLKPREF